MPEAMERALKAKAKKMGLGKERTGAFVYGTMRKTGWKPNREVHSPATSHDGAKEQQEAFHKKRKS